MASLIDPESSLNRTLSSVNDDLSVKYKQVIKNLIQENQKLTNQIEKLQYKQNLIREEAKRWKREFNRMSEKCNTISEISEARLDMIDDLCDEIERLDKIVYHKPF